MFKKIRLYKKQSQGLSIIKEGMEIQIIHFNSRKEHYIENGRTNEANECDAMVRRLTYWKNEVEKALNGELHF